MPVDWSVSIPKLSGVTPNQTTPGYVHMREIALMRHRYGYQRIELMLAREGIIMTQKRLRQPARRFRMLNVIDDHT